MKWSHWDYSTNERVSVEFDNAADAREQLVGHNHLVISHATTEEDYMYLGEGWQCSHLLHPTECINCNPEYRNAFWARCPECNSDTLSGMQWHIPVGSGRRVRCLKCDLVHLNEEIV